MEFIGRREFTVNDDEWTIEVGRAVDLKLISEGIAWESIAVALEKQNVQTDVIALRVLDLAVVLERNLLSEDAEERLLVGRDERTVNGLPK